MGTITILNGTNVMINSCISAGVNYSWCNKLSPGKYYKHDGGIGVYTLNTNYWLGETSEYSNSAAVIGTFVGALVVGVLGVALIPFTGGTSTTAIVASAATIAGAFTAATGLAITGISIAVEDFRNQPSNWTNIHANQDRKFIAEATIVYEEVKRDDGTTQIIWKDVPDIQLRELTHREYIDYITNKGYTDHQLKPIVGSHITASALKQLGVLNKSIMIRPANGGDTCWEIEDDQTRESAPIQLWSRRVDKVHWKIQPVDDNEDTTEFYIYNPSLQRYATSGTKSNSRIRSSRNREGSQKFHIIKTEDERRENCYIFIPVNAKERVVISENGNLGNSTKLILGPTRTKNPTWALWKLDLV